MTGDAFLVSPAGIIPDFYERPRPENAVAPPPLTVPDERMGEAGYARESSFAKERPPDGGVAKSAGSLWGFLRGVSR